MSPRIFTPLTPKSLNTGNSRFGVTLRVPVLLIQQPQIMPFGACWMGGLELFTECPDNLKPQVMYNQENLLFVKNHNFFVKQGMKTFTISFNQTHFVLFLMKNHFEIMNG